MKDGHLFVCYGGKKSPTDVFNVATETVRTMHSSDLRWTEQSNVFVEHPIVFAAILAKDVLCLGRQYGLFDLHYTQGGKKINRLFIQADPDKPVDWVRMEDEWTFSVEYTDGMKAFFEIESGSEIVDQYAKERFEEAFCGGIVGVRPNREICSEKPRRLKVFKSLSVLIN